MTPTNGRSASSCAGANDPTSCSWTSACPSSTASRPPRLHRRRRRARHPGARAHHLRPRRVRLRGRARRRQRVPAEGHAARGARAGGPRGRRGEALLAPRSPARSSRSSRATAMRRAPAVDLVDALTDRETEVLRLMARGLSNGEIADGALRRRDHRQDPREPGAHEARRPRPGPGGRRRLRDRPGPSRRRRLSARPPRG